MKDLKSFEADWKKDIKPKLAEEKAIYKKNVPNVNNYLAIGVFSVLIGMAVIVFLMIAFENESDIYGPGSITMVIVAVGIVIGVLGSFNALKKRKEFMTRFKGRIFKDCLTAIDPGLHFDPSGHIAPEELKKSMVFDQYDFKFGEDLLTGQVDKVSFSISEVSLSYTYLNKRRNQSEVEHKFFIIIEVTKPLDIGAKILIYPDVHLRNRWIYHTSPPEGMEYIKNSAYEGKYTVMADRKEEAEKIVNQSLFTRLEAFQEKTQNVVFFSMYNNKMILALPKNRGNVKSSFMEFHTSGNTITHFSPYKKLYEDVNLYTDMVKILTL